MPIVFSFKEKDFNIYLTYTLLDFTTVYSFVTYVYINLYINNCYMVSKEIFATGFFLKRLKSRTNRKYCTS